MLWIIGLALLISYYIGPTTFQVVAVLSVLFVAVSLIASLVGLKTVRRDREMT